MELLDKVNAKSAHVGVVGLGYVGLPLVIEFCRAGFSVTGFDIDNTKIDMLNEGTCYIKHVDISCLTDTFADKSTTSSN